MESWLLYTGSKLVIARKEVRGGSWEGWNRLRGTESTVILMEHWEIYKAVESYCTPETHIIPYMLYTLQFLKVLKKTYVHKKTLYSLQITSHFPSPLPLWICLFWTLRVNGIIQTVAFYKVWLVSMNIMLSKLICVAACISTT